MAIPGPYSGVSTLAFVARASALAFGVVYGSVKLSYVKHLLVDLLPSSSIVLLEDQGFKYHGTESCQKLGGMAKAKSHKKAEEKSHH